MVGGAVEGGAVIGGTEGGAVASGAPVVGGAAVGVVGAAGTGGAVVGAAAAGPEVTSGTIELVVLTLNADAGSTTPAGRVRVAEAGPDTVGRVPADAGGPVRTAKASPAGACSYSSDDVTATAEIAGTAAAAWFASALS